LFGFSSLEVFVVLFIKLSSLEVGLSTPTFGSINNTNVGSFTTDVMGGKLLSVWGIQKEKDLVEQVKNLEHVFPSM
jgi:hypothetical protein